MAITKDIIQYTIAYNSCFILILQINVRSKPLSHTRVVFDIHDRDRLRGDPHLGQVIMGLGSTEESVMEHWEEAIFGNGRKICRWHYIMDKGETHDY